MHYGATLFAGGCLRPRSPPGLPRWSRPCPAAGGCRVLPGPAGSCRGSVSNLPAATRRRGAARGKCGCARAAAFTRRFHHAPGPAARAASAAAPSAPPRAAGSCPLRARRCLEPPAPPCCCGCRPGSPPGLRSRPAGPAARAPPPRPPSPPPPGAAWTAPGLRRCWHLSGSPCESRYRHSAPSPRAPAPPSPQPPAPPRCPSARAPGRLSGDPSPSSGSPRRPGIFLASSTLDPGPRVRPPPPLPWTRVLPLSWVTPADPPGQPAPLRSRSVLLPRPCFRPRSLPLRCDP